MMIILEIINVFMYNFSRTLPRVLSKDIGLLLDTSVGSIFLNTGVTLACFQRFGTLPLKRENLKRSVRGADKG